jgi:two-component system, OmpR family, sensor histidine kinase KdpD
MLGSCAMLALALVGLGALMPLVDPATASLLRHVLVLPVLAIALRYGPVEGGLAASIAVMAQAPRLLSQLEEGGMTVAAADEAIAYVTLLGLAPLVGALAGAARRQRARYDTLLAVQRVVAEERSLPEMLDRLRTLLAERCEAAALVLVVRDADRLTLAGADRLVPGSVVARALDSGNAVFVSDTGTEPRPRRVLAVPLLARGEVIGILGLERVGELGGSERASLMDLGTYLGLALENARLAAVHRRFNVELAEKVAAATRHLAALDQAKSTFVATVSHELRTPLTALLGFSELLATRRVPAGEVARLAGIVQSETERMARIVDDLLDLARIERGTALRVRPVPVVLAPALAAAVAVFGRGRVSHRVVLACPEDLAVRADPDALDRVVKNLVSNAIKYSPAGSPVTLSARRRAAGVEIAVADEGPGIAPEALAYIFEPYYRASDATRTAPGLGLGLAVVKALVEAQGGTIAVESVPGRGTRVTVALPSARADAPELVPLVS